MSDRPRMYDWSDACEYMDNLEAENERLRAALQQIAAGTRDDKMLVSGDMMEIAENAINQR